MERVLETRPGRSEFKAEKITEAGGAIPDNRSLVLWPRRTQRSPEEQRKQRALQPGAHYPPGRAPVEMS